MRTLKPLRNRIFVKRVEHSTSMGGIVLPGNREQQTNEGEVVAVGPGFQTEFSGEWIKPQVKVGDKVLYAPDGQLKIDFEGEEYVIVLDDSAILSLIVGEKDE